LSYSKLFSATASGSTLWTLSQISSLLLNTDTYKDTEAFSVSCYCKPGTCWHEGTSWCLACPAGEYQNIDEAQYAKDYYYQNYFKPCRYTSLSTMKYPFIAPSGACSKVRAGKLYIKI
jgi:hypothetical protein